MPRAIRRAKKTGTSCRFMTHGIDQSASWNAATPASRDRTIFATFTASAPHTPYRELRILDDDRVPFILSFILLNFITTKNHRQIIPRRLDYCPRVISTSFRKRYSTIRCNCSLVSLKATTLKTYY